MLLHRPAPLALGAWGLVVTGLAGCAGSPGSADDPGVCAGVSGCRVVASADVNGDGRADPIGLVRKGGGLGERGTLTVRVATSPGRVVSVRRPLENWTGTPWQGAATLDSRPGRDLMLGRQMGASAQFYQSLTWRRGALVALDAPGPDRWWGVGRSATVIGGWLRRAGDPPGVVSARVATSAAGTRATYRGRVTTYRWTPAGWHRAGMRTVYPLSMRQVRHWAGFHVPGLARW
jgi:hypothetical protein